MIYVEFVGWTVYWVGLMLIMAAAFWPRRCTCHSGKRCAYCLMREGEI